MTHVEKIKHKMTKAIEEQKLKWEIRGFQIQNIESEFFDFAVEKGKRKILISVHTINIPIDTTYIGNAAFYATQKTLEDEVEYEVSMFNKNGFTEYAKELAKEFGFELEE